MYARKTIFRAIAVVRSRHAPGRDPQLLLASIVLLLMVFAPSPSSAADKEMYFFGITPWEKAAKLKKLFNPVMQKLTLATGKKFVFIVAKDYNDLNRLMKQKKIDFAQFSPSAYVRYQRDVPDSIYLATMKNRGPSGDIRDYYYGLFVARADDPGATIPDFKGRKVGFVNKDSASGYKYPVEMLIKMGIDSEKYFSKVYFLQKHPVVTDSILSKNIDLGATWDNNLYSATLKYGDVFKVILRTPPIPNDAVAAIPGTDRSIIAKVSATLISIRPDDAIFNDVPDVPTRGWSRKNDSFYDIVRKVSLKNN